MYLGYIDLSASHWLKFSDWYSYNMTPIYETLISKQKQRHYYSSQLELINRSLLCIAPRWQMTTRWWVEEKIFYFCQLKNEYLKKSGAIWCECVLLTSSFRSLSSTTAPVYNLSINCYSIHTSSYKDCTIHYALHYLSPWHLQFEGRQTMCPASLNHGRKG